MPALTADTSELVLSGFGPPNNGTLAAELDAAGVSVDDVTKVLLTHGHPDHIGGLVSNTSDPSSALTFSNAEVRA